MRFPRDPALARRAILTDAQAEISVERHPEHQEREDAPVGERLGLELMQRRADEIRHASPGCGLALKMNLSAPAICPEIAAEAPTTGAMSPK